MFVINFIVFHCSLPQTFVRQLCGKPSVQPPLILAEVRYIVTFVCFLGIRHKKNDGGWGNAKKSCMQKMKKSSYKEEGAEITFIQRAKKKYFTRNCHWKKSCKRKISHHFSNSRSLKVVKEVFLICNVLIRYWIWGCHHCIVSSFGYKNWQSQRSKRSFLQTKSSQFDEPYGYYLCLWNCYILPGKTGL